MTNYFRKTIYVDLLNLTTVTQWIKDNYPDAELDFTTFQDNNNMWHYMMVSYLGSNDLGFEDNVDLGLSKWSEHNGVQYHEWHSSFLFKYKGHYWHATH